MTPPADEQLIARARGGDRSAFTLLVERYRGPVHRFARLLVADESSAEDVLQETFIAALEGLAAYRGEGSVKAWLFAIARAKAWRLRHAQHERYLQTESLESLARRAGFGAPLTPEELTSRVERRSALEAALARLLDEEREVVSLRDVEGLSGEETAAALDLSLAAMKSRLHRGRLHLLVELKKEAL